MSLFYHTFDRGLHGAIKICGITYLCNPKEYA
jgi:hypothetical protein